MSYPQIGFGSKKPRWVLHIANRPELEEFQHDVYKTLSNGEAAEIITVTSNHWRKAFSIMAKISFALFETGCDSWQEYRDTKLLTKEGFEAIDFEPYQASTDSQLALICGFGYAEQQVDLQRLIPHIKHSKLLIDEDKNFIVTPYFDWRQLTNEILASLVAVMESVVTDQ